MAGEQSSRMDAQTALFIHNMFCTQMASFLSIVTSVRRVRAIRNNLEERLVKSRKEYEAAARVRARHQKESRGVSEKRLWMIQRPQGAVFWSNVLENFTGEQWRHHFRMSRDTFEFVLKLVEPTLRRKTTNWRKPLEPRRRLAIVLWWYAIPCEYRTISRLFGVGLSTVCKLVNEVTAALKKSLYKHFICLPGAARLQQTVGRFAERGYLMCGGAVGVKHIPVFAPREDASAYFNRKGYHSILLQGVVDHNFCFTDVYVGLPGRQQDAEVLSSSPIYKVAEEQDGYLFPREQKSVMVNGVEVPVHLIGDAAYPLKNWLMKEFTNHYNLSPQQQHYNNQLRSARMVVESAFRRLRGRWRCLLRHNNVNIALMTDIVVVCCVLHNICEDRKELFVPDWNNIDAVQEPASEIFQGPEEHNAQAIREAMMTLL